MSSPDLEAFADPGKRGLVRGEKSGQFVTYSLVRENLTNTLNGFVQRFVRCRARSRREVRIKQRRVPQGFQGKGLAMELCPINTHHRFADKDPWRAPRMIHHAFECPLWFEYVLIELACWSGWRGRSA